MSAGLQPNSRCNGTISTPRCADRARGDQQGKKGRNDDGPAVMDAAAGEKRSEMRGQHASLLDDGRH